MADIRKFPEGRDLERLKKAHEGRKVVPRVKPTLMQAARWLESAGYHDAAAALTHAARGKLKAFWTHVRVSAFTRMTADAEAEAKEPFATAELLFATADFLQQKAAAIHGMSRLTNEQAVRIRKILAVLAVAVLDLADPDWKTRDDS